MCGLLQRDMNFILPVEHRDNMCRNITKVVWSAYQVEGINYPIQNMKSENMLDACIQLMSAGFYKCYSDHAVGCKRHSLESKKSTMNNLLNNAPASFKGIILQLKKGTYHYTCSRNNNFSNRSQKASIIVKA